MADIQQQLVRCFQTVFPDLTPEQAAAAAQESLAAWDSVATINLMAVIEEEFGVGIDYEQLESLNCFDAVRRHILGRMPN